MSLLAYFGLFVTWAQSAELVTAGSVEGFLSTALKGASSRHYVFGDDSSYEPGDYYLTIRQARPPGPSNILRPNREPPISPTAMPSPSVTPVQRISPSPQLLNERRRCQNLEKRRDEEFTVPYLALKRNMKRLIRLVAEADSAIDRAIFQARLDTLRAEEAVLQIRGEKLLLIMEREACFTDMSPSPSPVTPSMTPSNSPSPSPTTRECIMLRRKQRVNLRKLTIVKRKKSQIKMKLSRSTLTSGKRSTLRKNLADLRLMEFELIIERAILLEKRATTSC